MNKGRAAKSMEEEQTQKDSYNRPNKTRSFIDPLFLSQFDSQSLSCTNSKSLWGWLNLNPSPINISILKKVKKKKLYIYVFVKKIITMYVLPCIINLFIMVLLLQLSLQLHSSSFLHLCPLWREVKGVIVVVDMSTLVKKSYGFSILVFNVWWNLSLFLALSLAIIMAIG